MTSSRGCLPEKRRGLLVCTLGATPAVVAEVLGKLDPEGYPFFTPGAAPCRSSLRIDDVWVITTDADKGKKSVEQLRHWWLDQDIGTAGRRLRIFFVQGTNELTKADENWRMAEAIFRVMLAANEKCLASRSALICSLAGGRKTMSAALQHAATLFGADEILHIVGSSEAESEASQAMQQRHGRSLRSSTPESISKARAQEIHLIRLGGYSGIESLLARIEGTQAISSDNFPLGGRPHPKGSGVSYTALPHRRRTKLRDSVEARLRESSRIGQAFLRQTLERDSSEVFPSLLRLPLQVIERLKTYRLGIDRSAQGRELAWLHRLPKADLHCHLGGVLDAAGLVEVVETLVQRLSRKERSFLGARLQTQVRKAIREPWRGLSQLEYDFSSLPSWAISCAVVAAFGGDAEGLDRWLFGALRQPARFRGVGHRRYERLGDLQGSKLLTHPVALEATCRILAEACLADNIRYLEVRCSPYNYSGAGSADGVIHRIQRTLGGTFLAGGGLDAGLLLMATRHKGVELMRRHIRLAERFAGLRSSKGPSVVGFDLAGNEVTKSAAELRELFRPLHKLCIPLTIHAGETASADSIWEAVYELGADRIGHGLSLIDHSRLLERFRDRQTTIEMCPSSNDQIVGFCDRRLPNRRAYSAYPLGNYLKRGLKVTINTDNPGISRTTLSAEYLKAAWLTPSGLTAWEILAIVRQGFASAFVSQPERQSMLLAVDREVFGCIDRGYVPWA